MPCNICGLHDGNQDQCGNCEKWFCYEHRNDCEGCGTACDNCVMWLDCGEHCHCDEWDCRVTVTWDCERGGCGDTGNCDHCHETCKSCNRPPGTEGVYSGG